MQRGYCCHAAAIIAGMEPGFTPEAVITPPDSGHGWILPGRAGGYPVMIAAPFPSGFMMNGNPVPAVSP
jgi:hypothetical protein